MKDLRTHRLKIATEFNASGGGTDCSAEERKKQVSPK